MQEVKLSFEQRIVSFDNVREIRFTGDPLSRTITIQHDGQGPSREELDLIAVQALYVQLDRRSQLALQTRRGDPSRIGLLLRIAETLTVSGQCWCMEASKGSVRI